LISDVHIGRKTRSFNRDIVEQRLSRLIEEVARRVSGTVHVMLLGDIVDGENVFNGQGYESDMDVDEAIDVAVQWLDRLYEKVEGDVRFHCVVGNHGRANRYGSQKANWDLVVYKRLRDRLGDNVVEVFEDWYGIVEVGRWRYLLMHGDNVKMYHNIPWYGIVQSVMRLRAAGLEFDVCCLGHFHTAFQLQWNDISILGNGTMLTGDDYSLRLGLKSCNEFWLFGVGKSRPFTWQYRIPLVR